MAFLRLKSPVEILWIIHWNLQKTYTHVDKRSEGNKPQNHVDYLHNFVDLSTKNLSNTRVVVDIASLMWIEVLISG